MLELVKKNVPAFFLNITMPELVKKNVPAFFFKYNNAGTC